MVDYTNAADGYIMVKAPKSKKKLKLRITMGSDSYNYDINGSAEYEVYPLQMGSGTYTVTLFENKSGNQYAQKAKVSVKVSLKDENAAFLCPSQYVWYTKKSSAVTKSEELCKKLSTDKEKLDAIVSFMNSYFSYDFIRSLTQKDAYLGDIDGVWKSRKGLCQDLACILACMLRVQGIPCKLVIGEVTSNSFVIGHAWNLVLIDGEWQRIDITAQISKSNNSKYTASKIY